MSPQLYLASRSPRRSQLLAQLHLRFEVLPADIPESPAPGQDAEAYVRAMALGKAQAARGNARDDLPVLGADTEVVIDGEVLGKPVDRAHGIAMLRRLSGRPHEVFSAVTVLRGDRCESELSITRVIFGDVGAAEADAYWSSGEPADKAGGYGIQGLGAVFVKRIEGSYSGVMGLPLFETAQLLARFGVKPQ
ncbi:MAG TPA: Maf family protein [Nevskiaceae bacterium]|nr:Maf family protein [Nevskiaceae bacterium]